MWSGDVQSDAADSPQRIGLDFDETITLAPNFWGAVVDLALANGHHVTVASFRFPDGDNADVEAFCRKHGVEAVYTAARQKSHVLSVDVWIDDDPVTIPEYARLKGMAQGCERMGDYGPAEGDA